LGPVRKEVYGTGFCGGAVKKSWVAARYRRKRREKEGLALEGTSEGRLPN